MMELPDKRIITFRRSIIKGKLSYDFDLRILAFKTNILEISIDHV